MKKPWQIWLTFALCLAIVTPAMGWLTYKTIQMDELRENDRLETEIARREAELQERISSALYRMDLKLLPLVSQEAARPHYLYESFFKISSPLTTPANNAPVQTLEPQESPNDQQEELASEIPSPLLTNLPEFVVLHFQIQADNTITSPQRPQGKKEALARTCCGITTEFIQNNDAKVELAKNFCSYDDIILRCDDSNLPAPTQAQSTLENGPLQQVYSVPQIKTPNQKLDPFNQSLNNIGGKGKIARQQSRGTERGNVEYNHRADSAQQFAGQQWQNNLQEFPGLANRLGNQFGNQSLQNIRQSLEPTVAREGVMQPMWIDGNLVLARRVDNEKSIAESNPVIQCCWLDWKKIRESLRSEVSDLLPEIEFQAIESDTELNLGTALATLPVQLVVDSSSLLSTLAIDGTPELNPTSGLRMSIWLAWCGLGIAALATALLLNGVIKLSERRATFVSAVTHELRTPLTTFRMYSEMLAEKMVPPGKQQDYANTLRVQADRLSHLVENVLQFARLEKGATPDRPETLSVIQLFDRFSPRLVERAAEAEMQLDFQLDSVRDTNLSTQPATIEQVVFNLVDNACKYAKPSTDNRIEVQCRVINSDLEIAVQDHGPGVAPKYEKRMFQPFCKSDLDAANTAPGVGLGLALCQRMAKSLGGRLNHVESKTGARFALLFPLGHQE